MTLCIILQALADKVKRLEEEVLGRQKTEDVEKALREVKEYASKRATELDKDVLFEKLIYLDTTARRTDHPLKDKVSFALSRFNKYRNTEVVAQVMVGLLCTKEESALLAQEQRVLKAHKLLDAKGEKKEEKGKADKSSDSAGNNFPQSPNPFPYPWPMWPNQDGQQGWRSGSRGRGNRGQRGGSTRPRGACFLCGSPSHYMRDCMKATQQPLGNHHNQQQQ